MSVQTKSGRRTVLKDNSWIRRNAEEDEPVEHDPNFGKVVLSQRSVDDVGSKPAEAEKPPVNSGTSISSLSKRFSGSQELLNKSSAATTNTKSAATVPPSPTKPPVPSKNPALKTPNTSSFTARVFSGANTSSKTLSPVKPSFGEKFPELTAPQTNGQEKSGSAGASVTVSPSAAPAATDTSTAVKSSAVTTAVKSPSRSESVSVSALVSTSSTPSAQTTVTNTKSSSWTLDETPTPAEKPSASPKQSEVRDSSAVSRNTFTSQTHSAPLDDLADALLPSLSGGVRSPPVRSQTQVKTVYTEIPAVSPTLRSPLQTTLESSSRPVSSRDLCTVCGKPIAGAERMILEELKIISHTSCFRCSGCRCDLGGLEAGQSLWVHRERVNCSSCFSKIRRQWYI